MRGPAVDDTESKACELLGGPNYSIHLVSQTILEDVSLLLPLGLQTGGKSYDLSLVNTGNYHYCLMCSPYFTLLLFSCIKC